MKRENIHLLYQTNLREGLFFSEPDPLDAIPGERAITPDELFVGYEKYITKFFNRYLGIVKRRRKPFKKRRKLIRNLPEEKRAARRAKYIKFFSGYKKRKIFLRLIPIGLKEKAFCLII